MSSWQHVPGVPGHNSYDGAVSSSLAGEMGGMVANGNMGMLNDLEMDMGLPMDLDMDLTQEPQSYNHIQQQTTSNGASQSQDQGMAAGSSNGTYATDGQHQERSLSGAGAGPLPTGFGMPAQSNSSTLTEFTKRRNWSQRIIEELKDFLHILTPDGRILYASPSCKSITGHEPHSLIGKFIAEYVHPDDSGIFMREFNESIASGNSLRFFYRFKKDDGTYIIFECDGHPHISPDHPNLDANPNPSIPPVSGVCRGFFMMARPYPTRNAALLDSFLEHKIENERLMRRIEELKREETNENAEQDKLFREHLMSTAGATPAPRSHGASSRTHGESGSETPVDYHGMPPPARPTISNAALTRQNLDSALSSQKPDSIADKMSRYEASSTHLESIELLTGLRYRDGERSHGISTGDTSPALVRGDAGIAILLDRDKDGPKKDKKKQKLADEYVCADCGTLDSPEWRKGPKGPKTLCNACGLRWAKKEKRKTGDDVKSESPVNGMPMSSVTMAAGPPISAVPITGFPHPPGLVHQHSAGSSN